ncbi:hypothetical protein N7G274_007610 [Stereocaulon virgatum]|uniref:Hemerythrin-like domain-containing protein n=1 Tax=Stereocaulon virgatum TaxID=373712 RepID=A0ABR4A463_9LECA
MSPDDSHFSPLLERLLKDLHTHIEHEANGDMPRLEKILSKDESRDLANQFERTKLILPTRSHPSALNKPYFENFAAMLAAPIDKFLDLLRSFPQESEVKIKLAQYFVSCIWADIPEGLLAYFSDHPAILLKGDMPFATSSSLQALTLFKTSARIAAYSHSSR